MIRSILYIITALMLPFYMVRHHDRYKPMYSYFRKRMRLSKPLAFCWTLKNQYRYQQIAIDNRLFDKKNNLIFNGLDKLKEIIEKASLECNFSKQATIFLLNTDIGNTKLLKKIIAEDKTYNQDRDNHNKENIRKFWGYDLCPSNNRSEIDDAYNGIGRFFFEDLNFDITPFKYAVENNCSICAVFGLKEKKKEYSIIQLPISIESTDNMEEDIKHLLQRYLWETQRVLQDYPSQWFNFNNLWD